MINWTKNKNEMTLEAAIVKRAMDMANKVGIKVENMTLLMDIDACHCNGNPLRLAELLEADDFNFAHDIFGIMGNINRATGKLENCFVPRYSVS